MRRWGKKGNAETVQKQVTKILLFGYWDQTYYMKGMNKH